MWRQVWTAGWIFRLHSSCMSLSIRSLEIPLRNMFFTRGEQVQPRSMGVSYELQIIVGVPLDVLKQSVRRPCERWRNAASYSSFRTFIRLYRLQWPSADARFHFFSRVTSLTARRRDILYARVFCDWSIVITRNNKQVSYNDREFQEVIVNIPEFRQVCCAFGSPLWRCEYPWKNKKLGADISQHRWEPDRKPSWVAHCGGALFLNT